jgi:tetratricopeptide (TPR) repeat protein
MIESFSVIVPVMNKECFILRTLESVESSIQYFYQNYQCSKSVEAEIVVVNDGSTDRTPEIIYEFIRNHPHCKVVSHSNRTSAGIARNTGANVAKGDLLFFCDGDDLYYDEHIYLCYRIISHDPNNAKETTFVLQRQDGNLVINLPNKVVGAVLTGVRMADKVHPFWKVAIENSIPQNLCVRRECHDFIEGFPVQKFPFVELPCEDTSYKKFLSKFFTLLKLDVETVEYIRYPGNALDRQLKKFQMPPGQYKEEISSATQELFALCHKLEEEHISYLFEKLRCMEKSPAFLSLMNWQQIGNDYMNQNCFDGAIPFFEYGLSTEPDNVTTRSLLAAAYNNQGSALLTHGHLQQAIDCYRKALDFNPAFSKTDLAKVNLNLCAALNAQKSYDQAHIYLQKAMELDKNVHKH